MQVYNGCKNAKKSAAEKLNIPDYAISVVAPNEKAAATIIEGEFYKFQPEHADNYFGVKVCLHVAGDPLAPDTFSSDFFSIARWDKAAGKFVFIEARPDAEGARPAAPAPLTDQERVAGLVLFGKKADFSPEEYGQIIDLINDTEPTFNRELAEAVFRTPRVLALHDERAAELLAAAREQCDPESSHAVIKKFLDKWLDTPAEKRAEQDAAKTANAALIAADPCTARWHGGGQPTDRSPNLVHTFSTLAIEIALGLQLRHGERFDSEFIPSSNFRRATETAGTTEPEFMTWRTAFWQTPNILNASRAKIFALIRTAPQGIENAGGAVLCDYLKENLPEPDPANPSPELIAAACGTTEEQNSVETKSSVSVAAGAPAANLSAGEPRGTGEPAPGELPVKSIGGGVFSIDGLAGSPEHARVADVLASGRGEFVAGVSDPGAENWLTDGEGVDSVPVEAAEPRAGENIDSMPARKSADETGPQTDPLIYPAPEPAHNLTWRQQLTVAALQGLCANPAYAGVSDDIPTLATTFAATIVALEGGGND
ncbi:hypothetical protein P2G74_01335 [Cronobacter muytjensii]|uniref:hypothetical protein n=1 Tax=Cronobacter muytjensii TaxID=413501 RepID=UPI002DBC68C3|nr:hypothetical protein [Cronobacter muytjensii]MEB8638616.1 hypothetical protein [Cronobacter muytjensii]